MSNTNIEKNQLRLRTCLLLSLTFSHTLFDEYFGLSYSSLEPFRRRLRSEVSWSKVFGHFIDDSEQLVVFGSILINNESWSRRNLNVSGVEWNMSWGYDE